MVGNVVVWEEGLAKVCLRPLPSGTDSLSLLVLSCPVEFKPFLVLPSITPIYTHVKLSNKDRHKRTFVYKHTLYKI